MSRVPLRAAVGTDVGTPRPPSWHIDLPNQYVGAERIARRRGLTRADTDAFGLRSQTLAQAAWAQGHVDHEVVPGKVPIAYAPGESSTVDQDEAAPGMRQVEDGTAREMRP